ncbi:MAG: alanine--glyoxylate aminotransferase family protein [Sphingomonadales bacterium]|jgi:alanine-glyoxylate transaminase/serine-glyoxylate transaminase/serine-pyruvate transaminase
MTSFPPQRILMGPGPSDVHPRVLNALSRPTIGHLDPVFQEMMENIKALLRYAFCTDNDLTIPLSAPGSAGMEAAFVNLLEPGDKVLILRNGVFGERMRENAIRCSADPIVIDAEWGTSFDLNQVEDAFKAHDNIKALAFVHAETSTGVRTDPQPLAELAHKHGALVIIDAVTSLGGIPLKCDEWELDFVYSGTQKCLSAPPGLSPITVSPRAIEKIRNRQNPVQSWFLDLNLIMGYWGGIGGRSYHHTAPVNALYGLQEALEMLKEEGLEAAHKRHQLCHRALAAGLEKLGLNLLVHPDLSLPQLNTVIVPNGLDEARLRQMLLKDFNIEIGAGLGALAGKVWRIGLMGQSATPRHVSTVLSALETCLEQLQHRFSKGEALSAAWAVLHDQKS